MNINIIAPINNLSYGIVAKNITYEFEKIGANPALFYLPPIDISDEPNFDYRKLITQSINRTSLFDNKSPSLRIYHQHSMAESVGKGTRYGLAIFELDKFTNREKLHLDSLDILFVCSIQAKQYLIAEKILSSDRIKFIPLGVRREIFNPDISSIRLFPEDYCVFMNVGKWEIRKGHDVLLEVFNNTFSPADKVGLVMMCECPFMTKRSEQWSNFYLNSKMGHGNIKILTSRCANQHLVAQYMNGADCGVFPARAEGWNLGLLEMMSMGKNVIATDYYGHSEFCSEDNCKLIPLQSLETAYDPPWFNGFGGWMSFGKKEKSILSDHMRSVYELYNKDGLYNNEVVTTASDFSWQDTVDQIELEIKTYED